MKSHSVKNIKFVSNTFSVNFSTEEKIRRKANIIEDILKKHYPTIQTLPIPDNVDPRMPRIVMDSEKGHSQIVISQASVALNIYYSEDWQKNEAEYDKQRLEYLLERVTLIFDLLKQMNIHKLDFSGLTSNLNIPLKETDNQIINRIANGLKIEIPKALNEVDIKFVTIADKKFFNNTQVKNFRSWKLELPMSEIPRLKQKTANIRGISVIGDFNDRYSFNEDDNYSTSLASAKAILKKGTKEIKSFAESLA